MSQMPEEELQLGSSDAYPTAPSKILAVSGKIQQVFTEHMGCISEVHF